MKHTYIQTDIHTERQTYYIHTETNRNIQSLTNISRLKLSTVEVLPSAATTSMLFTVPQESGSKIENHIDKDGRIICARSRGRFSAKIKHDY